MNDIFLKSGKDGFFEGVETMALQIVEQRGAKFLLIRVLDDSQVRFHSFLLVRLQIVEEVDLD